MSHKKLVIAAVALVALAVPTVAQATGEQSQVRFAPGTFAISPTSCKFVHAEADKPMGSSWSVGKVWAAYEDARHDTKMACNTARQTRVIACFATPIPPVTEKADHGPGKPGDEKGAAAAVAAVRDIQTCVLEAGGLAP